MWTTKKNGLFKLREMSLNGDGWRIVILKNYSAFKFNILHFMRSWQTS